MSIRQDDREELSLSVDHLKDRGGIRVFVINTWLGESPGTKYRYFVETLAGGDRIYLERPASLNKGCDFSIFVENLLLHKNGNDRHPPHQFLLERLKDLKKSCSASEWNKVLGLVEKIYNCENVFRNAAVSRELELCLKLVKWFFIEQDVTYWNNSGRAMLYGKIREVLDGLA